MLRKKRIALLLFLAAALTIPLALRKRLSASQQAISANVFSGETTSSEGFQRAEGVQPLVFPADLGPHPTYQSEWWYYTGNLESEAGRHFGYQLTFFRRALKPSEEVSPRSSAWASEQIYFAHFALSDSAGGEHHDFERFSRGAAGLAGAQADPYAVWLEDWRVELVEEDSYLLTAAQGDLAIQLRLKDEKGVVLQGEQGYSQKGPEPGNASYYYSQTRLASSGEIRIGEQRFEVSGMSWKDHEYSTSALSPGQVGWDWFSVQLDEGSDLMFFQIRRADGSIDPFSSGTVIAPDGSTQRLSGEDFEISVEASWRSPHSGAEYPARWTVRIPSVDLRLEIEPYLADQEMNLSFVYWEGAVRIRGTYAGQAVSGKGYVEMTGYAASIEGQF